MKKYKKDKYKCSLCGGSVHLKCVQCNSESPYIKVKSDGNSHILVLMVGFIIGVVMTILRG